MKYKITNETLNKVESFFKKTYVKDTLELSIIRNDDGSYELFDHYRVINDNKKYRVEIKHSFETKQFNTLKNAFIWIVFHKRKDYKELVRIEQLDQKIEGINFSIEYLHYMIKKTKNMENVLIYSAKLSQDQAVKKKLMLELNKMLDSARKWHFLAFKAKEQI